MILAYILEKRGSGLLVLKGKEYDTGHLSAFFSRELWRWPMPSSSREEEVCPSGPEKNEVMTMVIFFLSSVESCGGDHGWSSREEEVCSVLERCALTAADKDVLVRGRSRGLVLMANLARLPSTPKKEGSLTMILFAPSSMESCEGGHDLCHQLLEKRRSTLLTLRRRI